MTFSNFLTGFQAMLDRDPIVLLIIASVALSALFLLSLGQPKTKGAIRDGELASLDAHDQPPAAVPRILSDGRPDHRAVAIRLERLSHKAKSYTAISQSERQIAQTDARIQETRGVETSSFTARATAASHLRVVNGQGR